MRTRWMPIAAVVLLSGCGNADDPATAPEAGVEFVCIADMAAERGSGRVGPDEQAEDVLAEAAEALKARLAKHGLERYRVAVVDGPRIRIVLSKQEGNGRVFVEQMLANRGHVQFRIEVKPTDRIPNSGTDHPLPARQPWEDTDAAFDTYKAAEVARWHAAQDAGTPYVPSRARLHVLPKKDHQGSKDPDDWCVLEVPGEGEGLDARHLRDPVMLPSPNTGLPTVLYEVATEHQKRFRAWTTANVGLPMALVVDGVVTSSPIINEPLSHNVQITLGGRGSRKEQAQQAQALVDALEAGALRIVLTIESERETGG